MRTLLLDSSYLPVKIISWQKAMILFLTGRAELVDAYEDVEIRSVSKSFSLPRVLRLFGRHKGPHTVRLTRQNIFLRDRYICQYCDKNFDLKKLTLDHVLPRSRGGGNTWENMVTCCQRCNSKKADKTPEEARMPLLKRPKKPHFAPYLKLRIKNEDPEEWMTWLPIKKKTA